jgi:4-hydroxy-tetrahydrodipicolinate synthase
MAITRSQLLHQLIPAVPVPFGPSGEIHEPALERYIQWMAAQPVGGVAVWAHTGRGLYLTDQQRALVLSAWRRASPSGRVVIAAAGASPGLRDQSPDASAILDSARTMARRAADLGADAVLAHPPAAFRHDPHPGCDGDHELDQIVLDYHSAIAEAGLPILLFYLYEAAGGTSYRPDVVAELLARPEVVGIKIATLDSVMTFQDIARLVKEHAPSKLIITGEDRFLGYSLMCGAEAALIGMGAACTALQAEFLQSFWNRRADRFLELNGRVDELAQHTFVAPMEGYIQRMLWCLVHTGVIPPEAAFDPFGPRLDPAEFERIGAMLRSG